MDETYLWSTPEKIAELDRASFGRELAEAVAARLLAGHDLYSSHRDYCGHGLVYRDGRIQLLVVHDGWPEYGDVVATWESEEEFVELLAAQSDFTCSGADLESPVFHTDNPWLLNNQRLTRSRLEGFVSAT